MRKQIIYILAAAVMTAGCAEKEAAQDPKGFGSIHIVCSANPDITVAAPATAGITHTDERPLGDAFRLTLTGENYKGAWMTIADFAATDTIFLEGPYQAIVAYGNPDTEGFDKPYYEGSAEFDIKALVFDKSVEITARIDNSLVVVRATEQFLKYFNNAKFTVTTASRNAFDFTPGVTNYTERPAYVKAETSLTVSGTARRQPQTGLGEGLLVKFEEQMLEATTARTRHIFKFDAPNAGSATLDIYVGVDENGEDKYVETRILEETELNEGAIPDHTNK